MFQTQNYYYVEYLGDAGITLSCLQSLCKTLQTHSDLTTALLLTNDQVHAFLLKDDSGTYYVIRSGFTSGYSGEGPKGLAKALALLSKHRIETEEILIPTKLLNRLNNSSLNDQDIDFIYQQKIIRPIRLHDYIYPFENEVTQTTKSKCYYPLELPYSIIDDRIFDLALLFKQDPDSALTKAYKRLEDIIRTRTGIHEHSTKLFAQAFQGENALLHANCPHGAQRQKGGPGKSGRDTPLCPLLPESPSPMQRILHVARYFQSHPPYLPGRRQGNYSGNRPHGQSGPR